MRAALTIALKAVRHGAHANLFSALALAAVLAPLIVLHGLKVGVISGMLANLKADPGILRIGVAGHRTLTEQDLATIRGWPETAFAAGAPRSIAATVEMRRSRDDLSIVSADWLPSAAGDPLLPSGFPALSHTQIALSQPLANKLDAAPGSRVIASTYRNSQSEELEMDMEVVLVLPASALPGDRALVSQARLVAMAAFSDGAEATSAAPVYDSLRLYARSLDAVAPLERAISRYGFRTSSAAENIAWVQNLDAIMGGVFAIISGAGLVGYCISLFAMISAGVRQSRPHLSLLRLLGMGWGALLLFPLAQSLAITLLGLALALALASAAAGAINALFVAPTLPGELCSIAPDHLTVAIGVSILLAVVVGIWQAWEIRSIQPSEALAESLA